jgi:hypothetical protein
MTTRSLCNSNCGSVDRRAGDEVQLPKSPSRGCERAPFALSQFFGVFE